MKIKIGITVTLACLFFFLATASVRAAGGNVYIAQSAAGGANGADCADAVAWSYFSVAGNWAPGTTFHICGTYTGAAGATGINVLGSGSSGNPITIKFEAGAVMQSPYWGGNPFGGGPGAITCNNQSYIVVDGGTNGVVQNTANGSPSLGYANQQPSTGVFANNCSYFAIQGKLTVQHIYVHAALDPSTNQQNTIAVAVSDSNNVSITGGTFSDGFFALGIGYNPGSTVNNITIANNTIDHGCHIFHVGDGNYGATSSGYVIHNNTIGPHNQEWADSSGSICHQNAFDMWAVNCNGTSSCSMITGGQIYDNTIESDMCSNSAYGAGNNCTGFMNLGWSVSGLQIFNNIIKATSSTQGFEGMVVMRNSSSSLQSGNVFYNNTFDMDGSGGSVCDCAVYKVDNGTGGTGGQSGMVSENNIYINVPNQIFENLTYSLATVWSMINSNVYYSDGAFGYDGTSGSHYTTLASWQGLGFDRTVSTANPNLTNYVPSAGGAVTSIGANLSGLGLTPLDSDYASEPRPASGAGPWAAGAYQANGSGPMPPSGLSAVVQ